LKTRVVKDIEGFGCYKVQTALESKV